ncbi:helix-turn-helix domain-containing protein [Entomomonas sp. E2T0]|uniref:helix-turn-helix domain-containing protein n=1 Tax=Entomomonas sp. E2T0 TaxID=2930213 RepID=UPI0039B6F0C7
MTVKLVAIRLDLVEVFATQQRPLFLSELAKFMDIPVSSCLGLVHTLLNRDYLYEVLSSYEIPIATYC